MHTQSYAPSEFGFAMSHHLWMARCVWLAARLRLADAIGERPVDIDTLARRTETEPAPLARLMRALAAYGVFTRNADGTFGPSALSDTLRSDSPGSQRAFIDAVLGHEHYDAWGAVEETLRTGHTAFDARFGMPVFDWFSDHPADGRRFGEAMTSVTETMEAAILAAHQFRPFTCAVDVGGGHGSLLRHILARHPDSRGIVFDLPEIVADGRRQWEETPEGVRMEARGGDFFSAVPAGDLYTLKFILHDWDDNYALRILRNIRASALPGARLAVMEILLPEASEPHPGWLMDMNMLVMTGGRERTAKEYASLLAEAGFRLDRITPTKAPMSVVEAILA
ncbi:methyltransferase [Indioceanicola profundi]|uniref:methyltransferase n=1 Tax=Indioceanicola profundi TaxID=2220096 RepID=UPI000E6AD7AF|nr:methyltransferase [Indioceanicola profundi]